MVKLLVLLFLFLSAIASVSGYVFLDKMIAAGETQIAEGQRRLEKGQSTIEEGEAELEAGKQALSEGKEDYAQAKDNPFLVLADNLLNEGKAFREGREQIAEGDRLVAEGERQINAGERRLDAGELKLSRGQEQLKLARKIRVACAVGGVVFTTLTIVFGFYWRRTLINFFKHADA